ADAGARIRRMFVAAFARPPHDAELAASDRYLGELGNGNAGANENLLGNQSAWRDFAQSLFNAKEFIFLR
ncbi:MAG: hypothetical protein ABI318_14165, partial [Chthoniobacteraceae bacterium]